MCGWLSPLTLFKASLDACYAGYFIYQLSVSQCYLRFTSGLEYPHFTNEMAPKSCQWGDSEVTSWKPVPRFKTYSAIRQWVWVQLYATITKEGIWHNRESWNRLCLLSCWVHHNPCFVYDKWSFCSARRRGFSHSSGKYSQLLNEKETYIPWILE